MRQILVSENEKEQKLLKLLQKFFKGQNDAFLYKMLRKKNILLNGKKANGKELLSSGDKVQLYFSEESLQKLCSLPKVEEGIWSDFYKKFIVYEDPNLILFNKPAGLLSENDAKSTLSVNSLLSSYLLEKGEQSSETRETFRPGIANRLDRNTSGLILFGKTLAASQNLGRLIQEHKIQKRYQALVVGDFQEDGLQESFIRKNAKINKVIQVQEGEGEPIRAIFSTIQKYRDREQLFSLLSVQLITGKTHQIRSQLAFLKHPILGDEKYGEQEINREYRKKGIHRQLLHAYSLSFPEIRENNTLSPLSEKNFEVPLPDDFQNIIRNLKLQTR